MSNKAIKWAKGWRRELTPSQRFVLLTIADYFNDDAHRSWPSVATICAETGLSRATVHRSIKGLENKGLIERERWVDGANPRRQLPNRFCLPLHDERLPCSVDPVRARSVVMTSGKVTWERPIG